MAPHIPYFCCHTHDLSSRNRRFQRANFCLRRPVRLMCNRLYCTIVPILTKLVEKLNLNQKKKKPRTMRILKENPSWVSVSGQTGNVEYRKLAETYCTKNDSYFIAFFLNQGIQIDVVPFTSYFATILESVRKFRFVLFLNLCIYIILLPRLMTLKNL